LTADVISIVPIVEGKGELDALPRLIRRILAELGTGSGVQVRKAARENKDTLLKPTELERFARSAALRARGKHGFCC